MQLTRTDIDNLEKRTRINLINSITGIKPANLVGTADSNGTTNLAIFSSVVHLGSNPPLLAFVLRPNTEVSRHTYDNIKQTGCYTINHVHQSFLEKAHFTSAKFEKGVSEFAACGLTEEYVDGFRAPFVKESMIRIGLEFREEVFIPLNGTTMVIGEVMHILLPEEAKDEEGHLDLEGVQSAGISGLNSYYSFQKQAQFPYAKVEDWVKR